MRKIFTLALGLMLGLGPLTAAEQTPDQIKTSAASTFTANGAGAITGPDVGTAVTNIADSFIPMLYATSGCYWRSNGLGMSASCTVGPVKLVGYTVATLPAGSEGDMVYVTDQMTACPLGGPFTGGGNVRCTAFFDGTSWTHQ